MDMDRMVGRRVFSRGPLTSLHFWLGSLFVAIASSPVIVIIVRYGDRVNAEAFRWLLLGIAAVWLFWIRVWMAHARIHQYLMREGGVADHGDFALEEAFELAYIGLTLVGFATLGLLIALWRVTGAR